MPLLSKNDQNSLLDDVLTRFMALLPEATAVDWNADVAALWREYRWHAEFSAHRSVDEVKLDDLLHIEEQKTKLITNTEQFLSGLPANNVLLWGARGTGKSSLIHALLNQFTEQKLRLVEVRKEDLAKLIDIVALLAQEPFKFIVFCDDLSFDAEDSSYKELKSALEGSIFKTAENVLIYATSNRRHLVPEYMSENRRTQMIDGELHEGEAVEEKISLSDRFGLWLSFYPFRQDAYLDVVNHWVAKLALQHGLDVDLEDVTLRAAALRWALARGVRNGRTAQYFARDWVGAQALIKKKSSN